MCVAALASGCAFRVYQPMSGLHRPVVVDPSADNFSDVRLTLRCIPGGELPRQAASTLCDRVTTLFENQGARVTTIDSFGLGADEDDPGEDAPDEPKTDLVVDLRASRTDRKTHSLSWLLCFASFTILPGMSEETIVQEVTIRDASGFVLLEEQLELRIVARFGAGPAFGNWLLDRVRPREERLSGATFNRDLSADLYGQLSQLVFNAKLHWLVLQESAPGRQAGAQ